MYELSLFSGAGGGLLGTHHLLGWQCVGYVEFADYPQRIIAARIRDGLLPEAPIFGDIRAFNREGYAAAYTGLVDVITAGFPCQPFSVAGNQLAENDDRNMWPTTIETIRIVKPLYVFLENVPGIISSGYIVTVCNDLWDAGYKVLPPLRLSASDCGAAHKGERIWVVATTNKNNGDENGKVQTRTNTKIKFRRRNSWPTLQDAEKSWLQEHGWNLQETFNHAEKTIPNQKRDTHRAIRGSNRPTPRASR